MTRLKLIVYRFWKSQKQLRIGDVLLIFILFREAAHAGVIAVIALHIKH